MKRKRGAKRKAPPQAEPEPSDDDEGQEEEDAEEVQMEFEFHNPDEDDYHGVGEHLKSGTWDFLEDLAFSELADDVVGQGNVGTLVKSDADSSTKEETVCGLLTALNLQQFKHRSWPSAVAKALTAKAKKHGEAGVADKLQALLQKPPKGSQVGLLLSERFVNLPPELVGPLHSALQADIEWSCSTPECPEDERPFYGFTHFVGLARLSGSPGGSEASGASSKPKKRRKAAAAAEEAAGGSGAAERQSRYLRFEDEAYVRRSDFSFTFPLSKAREGPESGPPEHRAVFAISRKAFEKVVKELEAQTASAGAAAAGGK